MTHDLDRRLRTHLGHYAAAVEAANRIAALEAELDAWKQSSNNYRDLCIERTGHLADARKAAIEECMSVLHANGFYKSAKALAALQSTGS